mgnify:CR=1 FL=1
MKRTDFATFCRFMNAKNPNRSKVKIRKWMDTPDMERYDAYIADWHAFLKQLRIRIGAELDGKICGESKRRWRKRNTIP